MKNNSFSVFQEKRNVMAFEFKQGTRICFSEIKSDLLLSVDEPDISTQTYRFSDSGNNTQTTSGEYTKLLGGAISNWTLHLHIDVFNLFV